MKKISLKYLGIMLMSTVSILFISCGADAEDEIEESTKENTNGGHGKLVRLIDVYKKDMAIQMISFGYDDKNRVTSVAYVGKEEVICGPQNYEVYYDIKGNILTLSYKRVNSSDTRKRGGGYNSGMGEAKLNSDGYIIEDYLESSSYELERNDYLINYYEYNNKGEVLKRTIVESKNNNVFFSGNFTWENGNMLKAEGIFDEYYRYTKYENKANLNLNKMFTQTFSEDIFGLALSGYMGIKDKNLINEATWEFDEEGYPIAASDRDYTYKISYSYLVTH